MRKKSLILICSILSTILLIGCGSKDDTSTNVSVNKSENTSEKSDTVNTFEENKTSSGSTEVKTNKSVRLFYYDGVNDKILYEDTDIKVTDGALVTAIINSLKNDKGENYCKLDSNISVKSAVLDKEKDLLTVNFGSKFVNNMNLGSGAESGVLQSIVNSLGYNFDVSKIYILIDGEEYSSGHILLEEGEAFTVNYEKTSKI